MVYCDIYLFCLWHESKPWWYQIIDKLKKMYDIQMSFMSYFPNDMTLARKFYDNENLIGGYARKLNGMKNEFIFCICKDKKMNDFEKVTGLKKKIRKLRNLPNDFNLIHASESIKEFVRQLKIIGELPWQSVTYI